MRSVLCFFFLLPFPSPREKKTKRKSKEKQPRLFLFLWVLRSVKRKQKSKQTIPKTLRQQKQKNPYLKTIFTIQRARAQCFSRAQTQLEVLRFGPKSASKVSR